MNRRDFIKKTTQTGLLLGVGHFAIISSGCRKTYDFELLLKDGWIIDGTGNDGFRADIGIRGGKIAALGRLEVSQAYRVISLDGLTVAPGFIDVHSHSEEELLVNPKAESKIRQGVTTEILGQDGGSVAPLTPEMQAKRNQRYQDRYGITVDWLDFTRYFKRLVESGIAVNVATLVGQGTLREYVLGMEDRPASPAEMNQMKELAMQALQQGALGISSGLEYTPGAFASTEEITELCSVMSDRSGLYATHMRNEDDHVLEAVDEAIRIARNADTNLHISHLKCMGRRNWDKLDELLARIEEARAGGLSVTFDRYPYVAYSTTLASLMPLWAREGGTEKFLTRLQDASLITKIRSATLAKVKMLGSWEAVVISTVNLEKNRTLTGKSVAEIARTRNQEPFEVVRSLIIEERNRVGMVGFSMSEENTARILAHPLCMIASDASALATYGVLKRGTPHPRAFGTFPRVLAKYVRQEKIMSLPQAIHKMTGLPATKFGLKNRGQIYNGYMADMVIFDPETIQDRATFSNPYQYPAGIEYVLVNGEVVVEKGEHTGTLPGKILKRI